MRNEQTGMRDVAAARVTSVSMATPPLAGPPHHGVSPAPTREGRPRPLPSATLATVFANPALACLTEVTPRTRSRRLRGVFIAESVSEIKQAPAGSLVLLSHAASAEATDYRLDVMLQWAAARRVAAVARFSEANWHPSLTALDLADSAKMSLISIPLPTDLTRLVRDIDLAISGGAEFALGRATQALQALATCEETSKPLAEMVAATSRGLGVSIYQRKAPQEGPAAAVVVNGEVTGYLCVEPLAGAWADAAILVLHALAAAAARMLEQDIRKIEIPARSRGDLLGELLQAEGPSFAELVNSARQLRLPIDGWHIVMRIAVENLDELRREELDRLEFITAAAKDALGLARGSGNDWYLATASRAIVMVHMSKTDPGPQGGLADAKIVTVVLERLTSHFPGAKMRAGVGTAHAGPTGLHTSEAEARTALAMTLSAQNRSPVVAFDGVGIRRLLAEWYTSDTVREAVRVQLEPLERLGGTKAAVAMQTLRTYLDTQGSVVRTAQILHLHRNAVAYRLQRIFDLLDVDMHDPDQRLVLQLACRARTTWCSDSDR